MSASAPGPVDDEAPHVLVVDDDERLRRLLQRYLAETGFRVTVAADTRQAKHQMGLFDFDALVLDIMMPGQSGLDWTRELRRTNDVPILLLTARGEPEDRITGLEHGADDYLAKPFEPRELLLRIQSILRRAKAVPVVEEVPPISFGKVVFEPVSGRLTDGDAPVRLTSGEVGLLRVLAASANRPVSRDDLIDDSDTGTARAVDVQITRLRRKIEPDPRQPRYIQTVRGIGYVLVPD